MNVLYKVKECRVLNYCVDSYDEPAVLQGDILKELSRDDDGEVFVIISADCDIANNKIGRSGLACLSILSLEDYFFKEHCAAKHQKMIISKLREVTRLINDHWLSLSDEHKELDGENIKNWIKEAEVDIILSHLKVEDKETESKIKKLYNIINKYLICKDIKAIKHVDLLAILEGVNNNDSLALNKVIKKYMTELSKNPPQDLFFIPSIPTLQSIGYVVKLRSLFFLPASQCFSSISKAKESPNSYLRIGRLTPTFKHALSQQFGTLFSRIGFPTNYERDVKDSFAIFLEKY